MRGIMTVDVYWGKKRAICLFEPMIRKLLIFWSLSDISENFAASHRIYDVEVIEFSSDVAFILILPPVEEVCLVPGQNDTMTEKKDLTLLPVQVFEMSKYTEL
jgi:hypothetical protein